MQMILIALAVIALGGLGALLAYRSPRKATGFGLGSSVLGAALGLTGAIQSLVSPSSLNSLRLPWSVPFGSFYLEVDALSAFFLLPIFLLTGLAAIYGARYMWEPKYMPKIGTHWAFYCTLTISMILVVIARNAVLFLISWEVMALASFFLVSMEHEKESVRKASWTYLVATHLGTMALFVFFLLLGAKAGSLDFDRFVTAGALIHPQAGIFFLLAMIGFGAKAGIVPLHVWLPEAHPAAPSHVSAVMSGVMIKTGIYGIIRTLTWLGPPNTSWALIMIAIGCISGVLGILIAFAQKDLKRLLAYSSVENIGIIFIGLGIGTLGQATQQPTLTILGYGGALLHILNHALFKGLLFLGAGSVQHGAQTLNLEDTGGLLRRMPWTGTTFIVGAFAICGLPPLNGFVSEFMIYAGAFQGVQSLGSWGAVPAVLTIMSLALIGGLAVACFTKEFGIIFLGEPRTPQTAQAHESKAAMRWPMIILAALCMIVGLSAPLTLTVLEPVLTPLVAGSNLDLMKIFNLVQNPLLFIMCISLTFVALLAFLVWLRSALLTGRTKDDGVTWDCGYAQPTAHMQYTASSFAQPFIDLATGLLRRRKEVKKPTGYFPEAGYYSSKTPDVCTTSIWAPVFHGIEWLLLKFRWMQTGSIHLYILYIAISLVALLIWKLR